MNVLLALANILSLAQSAIASLYGDAPEPVWMFAWGLALLLIAAAARSLMERRESGHIDGSVAPVVRSDHASIVSAARWRDALLDKLVVDRTQPSN